MNWKKNPIILFGVNLNYFRKPSEKKIGSVKLLQIPQDEMYPLAYLKK